MGLHQPRRMRLKYSGGDASAALMVVEEATVVGLGGPGGRHAGVGEGG